MTVGAHLRPTPDRRIMMMMMIETLDATAAQLQQTAAATAACDWLVPMDAHSALLVLLLFARQQFDEQIDYYVLMLMMWLAGWIDILIEIMRFMFNYCFLRITASEWFD